MTFKPISTSRLGAEALCEICRAGSLISFSWPDPPNYDDDENWRPMATLQPDRPLRYGSLYRCGACGRPWHLNRAGDRMTIVPEGRLDLILEWSRAEILLPDDVLEALGEIGPTPPDLYGNGREYVETPCGVVTHSGERVEAAIVSIQRDAPIEEWRRSRLASEVAEVYPSPHALPLDVRLASTQADEVRMGYAPSFIEMPDGRRFTLNWTANFLNEQGYRAADARICDDRIDVYRAPPIARSPGIVYFAADG